MNKNQQILAHAKAADVLEVGQVIIDIWKNNSPNINQQLYKNLEELDQQIILLNHSFKRKRKGTFTLDMRKLSKQIASLYVGLKYLVKSFLHHPDEEKRRDAKIIWRQIVAIGVDIHKKNIGEKCAGLQKLVHVTSLGELKSEAKNLDGIEVFIDGLRVLHNQLIETYNLSIEEKIKRRERVQATAQGHKVHKILNEEILPFLFTFRKVDPENYEQLASIAEVKLIECNKKIRVRRNIWAKRRAKEEQKVMK